MYVFVQLYHIVWYVLKYEEISWSWEWFYEKSIVFLKNAVILLDMKYIDVKHIALEGCKGLPCLCTGHT